MVKYTYGLDLIESDYGWYVYNANGDVVALADGNGVVTRNYEYDPYGVEIGENSSHDVNPYRYSGQYKDLETGYVYLRARYYDPSTGRFINQDPIMDGENWYIYCSGNPLLYVDPSGLAEVAINYLKELEEKRKNPVLYQYKKLKEAEFAGQTISSPHQLPQLPVEISDLLNTKQKEILANATYRGFETIGDTTIYKCWEITERNRSILTINEYKIYTETKTEKQLKNSFAYKSGKFLENLVGFTNSVGEMYEYIENPNDNPYLQNPYIWAGFQIFSFLTSDYESAYSKGIDDLTLADQKSYTIVNNVVKDLGTYNMDQQKYTSSPWFKREKY